MGKDTETCGAWGGCPLPRGHNRGRPDIPENHSRPSGIGQQWRRELYARPSADEYGEDGRALPPPEHDDTDLRERYAEGLCEQIEAAILRAGDGESVGQNVAARAAMAVISPVLERLRAEAETQGRLRCATHRDFEQQRQRAEDAEAKVERQQAEIKRLADFGVKSRERHQAALLSEQERGKSWAEKAIRLQAEVNRLRELTATCTCYDGNPANYEGPRADCPVHGAVRAFNEERAATDRVRKLHDFEEKEWFTPCDRHQPYRPGVKNCPDCRTEVRRTCTHCTDFSGMGVRWPCPTVAVLDAPGGES